MFNMGWNDKPTKTQINALHHLAYWGLPTTELRDALHWLENNGTRKQASDELGRIRELHIKKSLNRDKFFESPVWEGYFDSKVNEYRR